MFFTQHVLLFVGKWDLDKDDSRGHSETALCNKNYKKCKIKQNLLYLYHKDWESKKKITLKHTDPL